VQPANKKLSPLWQEYSIPRERMTARLREHYGIRDPRVLEAMRLVPRHFFVPEALQSRAYGDHALPISANQTISQPFIVARMTELLELDGYSRVLEIGAGSGYQTAVLAMIAAQVYAIERIGDLAREAQSRIRQLEIYNIVLGAQNAVFAALKPGMNYCKSGDKSLYKISYDYINSHGKDRHGKRLGQYYIHGLGHNIGLDVHDPGDYCKPLVPGQVVTVEPGIYIPEENLGVRIEDDLLITDTGFEFLSERLPRDPAEIEKIMAEAARARTGESSKPN